MEAERRKVEQYEDTFTHLEELNTSAHVPELLTTSGIFFQCPMIGKFFYIKKKNGYWFSCCLLRKYSSSLFIFG